MPRGRVAGYSGLRVHVKNGLGQCDSSLAIEGRVVQLRVKGKATLAERAGLETLEDVELPQRPVALEQH